MNGHSWPAALIATVTTVIVAVHPATFLMVALTIALAAVSGVSAYWYARKQSARDAEVSIRAALDQHIEKLHTNREALLREARSPPQKG